MDDKTISLIRATWSQVIATGKLKEFFTQLFIREPVASRIFLVSSVELSQKHNQTIRYLLGNLGKSDLASRSLKRIGKVHREMGVTIDDYIKTIIALHMNFKDLLGDKYSRQVGHAWSRAFIHMIKVMIYSHELKEEKFGSLKVLWDIERFRL